MLTVSVERGVSASDAVKPTDPATTTLDGVRPEGVVMQLIDLHSNKISMWWAIDSTTVVWVYGDGLSEVQMIRAIKSIEVLHV